VIFVLMSRHPTHNFKQPTVTQLRHHHVCLKNVALLLMVALHAADEMRLAAVERDHESLKRSLELETERRLLLLRFTCTTAAVIVIVLKKARNQRTLGREAHFKDVLRERIAVLL
jgi:hypothetical protein